MNPTGANRFKVSTLLLSFFLDFQACPLKTNLSWNWKHPETTILTREPELQTEGPGCGSTIAATALGPGGCWAPWVLTHIMGWSAVVKTGNCFLYQKKVGNQKNNEAHISQMLKNHVWKIIADLLMWYLFSLYIRIQYVIPGFLQKNVCICTYLEPKWPLFC